LRVFGTIVVGLIFMVAFVVAVLLNSALSFPTDSDAIVEVVRATGAREAVVKAVEQAIVEETSKIAEESVRNALESQIHGAADTLIDDEWFHEAIGASHAAFVALILEDNPDKKVVLAPFKERLKSFATNVMAAAIEKCKAAGDACASGSELTDGVAVFEAQLDTMLGKIPDEASIRQLADVTGQDLKMVEDQKELEEFREGYSKLKLARWAGLGILLLLGGLIALINSTGPARIFINLGVVFLLSAGLYLAVAGPGGQALLDEVKKDQKISAPEGSAEALGKQIGSDIAVAGFEQLFGHSNWIAYGTAGFGGLMFIGGIAMFSMRKETVATSDF
jgi:hypothetical protein